MKLNLKFIIFLIYLTQNNLLLYSALPSQNTDNQWYISGRTGLSMLIKEVTPDFRFLNNEFKHQPGLTLDLTISRSFNEKWEPGINLSLYRLTGHSELPDFSAVNNHYAFINLHQLPVEYATVTFSLSAYWRYYFLNNSGKSKNRVYLRPYAEIGAGVNFFFTELGYSVFPPEGTSRLIYYKGTQKSGPGAGNVAQIVTGLGTRIVLPANIDMIVSFNADIVNYDCLDTVHNYTNEKRNHAISIVPKFLLGVIIPISNNDNSNRFLPWSP